MFAAILPANAFYARKFQASGIDPQGIRSLADLHRVPLTTKQELLDDQAAKPPYGTNLTYPLSKYCRLHQTSGTSTGVPLRWLDTPESWHWFMECWRQKYEIMGLRREDRMFFPFSFGPFVGFWAAFEAAVRLGNLCLPAGGMSSSARLRFMLDNDATIVCCTPTYALRLAEVAKQEGLDLAKSPVRALIVAGEPGGSIPSTRQRIEESWGARVFDHTGMTEIGSLGMECVENPCGVHLLETECIPEVVGYRPSAIGHQPEDPMATDSRQPTADSRQPIEGELVLTNLGRWGSPLIRYRTGDRVVVDTDPCPCGRPFLRLKGGILGRTDDMIVIRGNNVYPSAIENILRRFPEIEEFRIEVSAESGVCSPGFPSSESGLPTPHSRLLLQLECRQSPPGIVENVREAIRNELNFRPEVALVPPGSLPRSEMKSRRVARRI